MSNQIAQTILAQLGGNRFIAMTGAKDFLSDATGLRFRLPRGFAKDGITHVHVDLSLGTDTYTVTFYKVRKLDVIQISELAGVYADQLRSVFTAATGLDTALTHDWIAA